MSRSPVASMLLRDDAGEAETPGQPVDVDFVARAGNRTGAERQLVGVIEQRSQPRMIAAQGRGMREEEVSRQNRLRAAQVRVGRHQRIAGAPGALREDGNHCDDRLL